MPAITPYLWFDSQAEEAVKFYVSIFKKSKLGKIAHYDADSAKATGCPPRSAMTVEFTLDGQPFIALNGGPVFKFNESISFVVSCQTQAELDHYWKRLTAGGKEVQCGWLKDKYGISWQIVPTILGELVGGNDTGKAARVMAAMMKMVKLDIKKLMLAAQGK